VTVHNRKKHPQQRRVVYLAT